MSARLPNLYMMPWFPRDFMASTRGWPILSRAIYRELLDCQWEQGGLSTDTAELRKLIDVTAVEWRAGWPRVAPKFVKGADGLLRNPRLEEHRQKAIDIARKRAHVGRQGGRVSAARRQANAKQLLGASSSNWCTDGQPSTQHKTLEAYEGGAGVLGESPRSTERGRG